MSVYSIDNEGAISAFTTGAEFDAYDADSSLRIKKVTGQQVANFIESVGVSVTAASTTSNTNHGVMTLTTAHAAGGTYPLAAPVAGVTKIISALVASTAARIISGSASSSSFAQTTTNLITSTGIQTIELIGLSTALWGIVAAYSPTTGNMTVTT
jgi:hypothetical protein